MKKALIIFGSTTGNTEEMAGMVKGSLEEAGFQAEVKEVSSADVSDLSGDYNVVLLGCPAYGDDEIELQDDFAEFYEKLDGISLSGKNYAAFAPGDSSYEYFCGSVDMLEDKMKDLGGTILVDGLKVEGDPADSEDDINDWVQAIDAKVA